MDKSKQTNSPSVISLFAGGGGLDIGFKKAGCNIVYANDNDKDAVAVYELNFGVGTIDKKDICTVNADDIPYGDILLAGFPCTTFSSAGKREGVKNPKGQLYKQAIRIIQVKQPKVVLFENVRGIFSSKTPTGQSVAQAIMGDLESLMPSYTVTSKILLASDYGVAQSRIRAFIIGVRKDLGITYEFPPKQSKEGLTVGDVLALPKDAPNQVALYLPPMAAEFIKLVPEGGCWHDALMTCFPTG